jgi:hypothetical protein
MADKSGLQLRNLLSLHRLTVPDSLTSAVRQECDALCNDSCPNLWLPEAAIHGKSAGFILSSWQQEPQRHLLELKFGPRCGHV